jgi:hypothetical protein
MDRSIDKIINPPWLKSIRAFEKQAGIAALALRESETMRSIRQFNETAKLASLAFSNSDLVKSTSVLAENVKFASLAFHELDAMKSIRQMTESSQLATLALKESEAMKSFKIISESTRISALAFQQSETAKQLQIIAKTSQLASIALKQSEAFNQISQFNNLSSFKALSNLANSPFSEGTLIFAPEVAHVEVTDEFLLDIDAQISEEISTENDFNALSEKTQRILLYLYHNYFLPIILSCLSTYMMANAIDARKELESVSTPSEARAFTKGKNNNFNRDMLKGYRVTTGDSLHFRESPSMSSEIITLLPVGTLTEVIDKSHRSWLLVEVEIDGVLEQGWVSRRYTAYFK